MVRLSKACISKVTVIVTLVTRIRLVLLSTAKAKKAKIQLQLLVMKKDREAKHLNQRADGLFIVGYKILLGFQTCPYVLELTPIVLITLSGLRAVYSRYLIRIISYRFVL